MYYSRVGVGLAWSEKVSIVSLITNYLTYTD